MSAHDSTDSAPATFLSGEQKRQPPGLALITGATAGIGAEFSRQLAARGYDLVLVSRDATRLEERARVLRDDYDIRVEVLAADLVTREGLALVESRLAVNPSGEPPLGAIPPHSFHVGDCRVTWLLNNAGFGLRQPFDENAIEEEQRHLDLLVTAPMRLTHAALGQMLDNRSGTIVNIASVAGYTPRGTYGAAKAWVLSFSRWANIYYSSLGVSVTAVAPGFVHTEFHDRMNVNTAGVPAFMWLDAATVVRLALRDIDRGVAVSVPTFRYKLVVLLSGWLPQKIVAAGSLRRR